MLKAEVAMAETLRVWYHDFEHPAATHPVASLPRRTTAAAASQLPRRPGLSKLVVVEGAAAAEGLDRKAAATVARAAQELRSLVTTVA